MKQEWLNKIVETDNSIKIEITKEDAYDELYEDCESNHSGCNRACPVYDLACEDREFKPTEHNDCPYFKNGKAMFERLQGKKLLKIKINGTNKIIDYDKGVEILKLNEE